MTDTNAGGAPARGRATGRARFARARTIRRRIIGGALALFVASWLLITIVLVSGNDPALAKHSTASTTASSSTPATTSSSTTTSGSGSNTSATSTTASGSSSSGSSSSGTVSGVTTSQS